MNFLSMQHIPLASAYLCPDCNCIGNCSVRCPACASSVLLGLAGVLDRKPGSGSAVVRGFHHVTRTRMHSQSSRQRGYRSFKVPAEEYKL
jgi:hypothetical protein